MSNQTGEQRAPAPHLDDTAQERSVIPDRLLSAEELNDWAKQEGFAYGRSGTFWDTQDRLESQKFLYIKHCHRVETETAAFEALTYVKSLTTEGVFSPETQWGVFQTDDGEYQLFATTPKLGSFLEDSPTGEIPDTEFFNNRINDVGKKVDSDIDPEAAFARSMDGGIFNFNEASNYDNWGWGADGVLYPLDVEIVQFDDPSQQAAIHDWYLKTTSQQINPTTGTVE